MNFNLYVVYEPRALSSTYQSATANRGPSLGTSVELWPVPCKLHGGWSPVRDRELLSKPLAPTSYV